MKAWEIRGAFGLDHLEPVERPDPEPGPGEVLVRLRAASINYRDFLMVEGRYNPRQPLPLVPCSDGAGEVVSLGPGAERLAPELRVGERVMPIFAQGWLGGEPRREAVRTTLGGPLDGTLAELMVARAEGVVPVPEHLSYEEAATLPCAGVTAWNALAETGSVRAGDTVLALGTGGVSIFALQLAQLLGARVIVTSSSPEKLARARELGAWEGVDYRAVPEWGKRVRELTGGEGVDHVIEVGGGETLPRSLQAVRAGGTISLIGVLSGRPTELDVAAILMRSIRVQGVLVGSRQSFAAMNRAIAQH
ncbi:MAG TPA: NAD(P)-dependent alcohol dehydrogenase, partial [Thermoanaerobaculia bacterium]|nr:NAD(P)-dependent alcohol dehydrogenase [Thermoanaerobaculia bacterium]